MKFGCQFKVKSLVILTAMLTALTGRAMDDSQIKALLREQISETYRSNSVKLVGPIHWQNSTPGKKGDILKILGDNGRGEIRFSVTGSEGQYAEGSTEFSASVPARIATKRIHPGEVLKNDLFEVKELNISSGSAREYRGILLSVDQDLSHLETVQTVMEGQFLTSSAVRNLPDVRRGDVVRIHLVNGDLIVSTSGIAQELGYVNKQIRVLTGKTKRELSGVLQSDGVVEVKL